VAVFIIFQAIAWARCPEFANGKDGIRLPVARRPLGSSFWRFRDLGLYLWDEVSYGNWSHHQPGELNVQIMNTRSLGKAVGEPPTRLFYRVPERYRADVEKALPTRGIWAQ
jgi:hypothetical protein